MQFVTAALLVIIILLLTRRGTRWVGLVVGAFFSGWWALICGAGAVLSPNEAAARTWGAVAILFAALALALLIAGIRNAIKGRRQRSAAVG